MPILLNWWRRVCALFCFISLFLIAFGAQAQPKTVRLLVGFPPGGGSDAIARLLAEKLQTPLGQSVVVENKAGAGGQIAAQTLKAAPADGSTFFLSHDHTISILPLIIKKPGFEPATDFVAVAGIANFANGLAVSSALPVHSLEEYMAWIRDHKAGIDTIGVPAPASVPEFLVTLIAKKYNYDVKAAPYRGSAPMIADMLGNQIAAGIASVPDFFEYHKAGKLRIISVIGSQRQAALPDVATFQESGVVGFEDLPYFGIFAHKDTPQVEVDRFSAAIAQVLALPEVHQHLTKLGWNVEYMTQQQLTQRERAYTKTWAKIIKDSGYVPQ